MRLLASSDVEWLRGRAWALALAVMTFPYYWATMPERCRSKLATLEAVLADANTNEVHMGRLIYGSITSLDGYVADEQGRFDWSMPSEEFEISPSMRRWQGRTYLYGRELYEVMAVWETMDTSGEPPAIVDFARMWRQADKIVYQRLSSSQRPGAPGSNETSNPTPSPKSRRHPKQTCS